MEAPPPWRFVETSVEGKIERIVTEAGGEGSPYLFFTGKGNFRDFIAVTKPYKDRPGERPYHYKNVKAFLKSQYEWQEVDGLEADDLLGIAMTKHPGKFICCSRDKDLLSIPGWHYGWEMGLQPSFGPENVSDVGWLKLSSRRDKGIGVGQKFFHYQLLVGDRVDSIPGVPRIGAVGAFKLLEATSTLPDMEEVVARAYKAAYGLSWLDRMRETGRLLHMTRERNGDSIKLYNPSFLEKEEWINFKTGEIYGS